MTPAITDTISWWAPFEALEAGQEFTTRGRTVTEADVVGFAVADRRLASAALRTPQWAAGSPFGERIAHGMLVVSLAAGLVPFDPGRVVALRRCPTRRSSARCGSATRCTSRAGSPSWRPASDEAGLVDVRVERRQPGRAAPCAARASRCCGGATSLAERRAGAQRRLRPDPALRWACSTARSS